MLRRLTAVLLLLLVSAAGAAGSWEPPSEDACPGNCPDDAPEGCPLDCHACVCSTGIGAMLAAVGAPDLPITECDLLLADAEPRSPTGSPRDIFHVPKPSHS